MPPIFETVYHPRFSILILAWFVADLLTPMIVWLSYKIDATDKPHSYKRHKTPTPFLGGVCIFIAFTVAIFSTLRFTSIEANREIFSILMGGFVLLLLGCLDDFVRVSAVIKLCVLILITVFVAHQGVIIKITEMWLLNLALTILWVAGISSAINSIDNMDGVATGVIAIASLFTFLITWIPAPVDYKQLGVSYLSFALLGGCLGFLRYNFKPARIFLGDNGSLTLGFLVATMMIFAGWSRVDPLKAIIIPCAVLAVPLYDITLSTILRIAEKRVTNIYQAIVYCGRDHLFHRLVGLGLTETQAVLLIYLFAITGGGVGLLIYFDFITPVIYVPLTIISLLFMVFLGYKLSQSPVTQ